MTTYRPTTIQLALDHCPAAVSHYEAGHPQDRRGFLVGTAAHEFLHALGEGRDLDALAERLLSVGRTGVDAEPPMPPDAVFQGRDLALAWVQAHPLPAGAYYEQRYAYDRAWQRTDAADAWFATRIDRVEVIRDEDEDGFASVIVVVTDYKSSWQATEDELDTLQRRAQAVVVALAHPDATEIRLEVASLRRRQVFSRSIVLDEDGLALLDRWRQDLDLLCQALEAPRVARPSPGCVSCPFVGSCGSALQAVAGGGEDLADLAEVYGAATAIGKAAEARLREVTRDAPAVVGGWEIGARPRVARKASATALVSALSDWLDRSHASPTPEQRAALEALAAILGEVPLGFAESLAKALHRKAVDRAAWLAPHLSEVVSPSWGVRQVEGGPVKPMGES